MGQLENPLPLGQLENLLPQNFREKDWRNDKQRMFEDALTRTAKQIADALGVNDDSPLVKIKEWYNPNIPKAYFLYGSVKIIDAMPAFGLSWAPLTGTLNRYEFKLT